MNSNGEDQGWLERLARCCVKSGNRTAHGGSPEFPPEVLGLLRFLRSPRSTSRFRLTLAPRGGPHQSDGVPSPGRPHLSSCGRTAAVQGLRRCFPFHQSSRATVSQIGPGRALDGSIMHTGVQATGRLSMYPFCRVQTWLLLPCFHFEGIGIKG